MYAGEWLKNLYLQLEQLEPSDFLEVASEVESFELDLNPEGLSSLAGEVAWALLVYAPSIAPFARPAAPAWTALARVDPQRAMQDLFRICPILPGYEIPPDISEQQFEHLPDAIREGRPDDLDLHEKWSTAVQHALTNQQSTAKLLQGLDFEEPSSLATLLNLTQCVPGDIRVHMVLASTAPSKRAIEAAKTVQMLMPHHPGANTQLANAALAAGDSVSALAHCELALIANPLHAPVMVLMANVLHAIGRSPLATALATMALSRDTTGLDSAAKKRAEAILKIGKALEGDDLLTYARAIEKRALFWHQIIPGDTAGQLCLFAASTAPRGGPLLLSLAGILYADLDNLPMVQRIEEIRRPLVREPVSLIDLLEARPLPLLNPEKTRTLLKGIE